MKQKADLYSQSGVDTKAGDVAVDLMRSAILKSHNSTVIGGFGGFAGLIDASELTKYNKPYLASSTDGVGTKVAISSAIDKHDTIGFDLLGMVIDDIVVVGAKPLLMTDYIACGKVFPHRIAEIVSGIALACADQNTPLIGGETAEHPGLLGENEYDVAGAAVGVVEADNLLGSHRVEDGDIVIALESSGLHSNGYSLVRKILVDNKIKYTDYCDDLETSYGLALLEPTRLYTRSILSLLSREDFKSKIHAISHITGGGIAANLARVLPKNYWCEISRQSWQIPVVFSHLAKLGRFSLHDVESAWNLGIGMCLVVEENSAEKVIEALRLDGINAWQCAQIRAGQIPEGDFEQNSKGVSGGAVRLFGEYNL